MKVDMRDFLELLRKNKFFRRPVLCLFTSVVAVVAALLAPIMPWAAIFAGISLLSVILALFLLLDLNKEE